MDNLEGFNDAPEHIKQKVQDRKVDQELIDYASTMEKMRLTYKQRMSPHGEKMVKKVVEKGIMIAFIKLWR